MALLIAYPNKITPKCYLKELSAALEERPQLAARPPPRSTMPCLLLHWDTEVEPSKSVVVLPGQAMQ